MACFVNAGERKVAVLPDLPAHVCIIDDDRGVACSVEVARVTVVYGEGEKLTAVPVACCVLLVDISNFE